MFTAIMNIQTAADQARVEALGSLFNFFLLVLLCFGLTALIFLPNKTLRTQATLADASPTGANQDPAAVVLEEVHEQFNAFKTFVLEKMTGFEQAYEALQKEKNELLARNRILEEEREFMEVAIKVKDDRIARWSIAPPRASTQQSPPLRRPHKTVTLLISPSPELEPASQPVTSTTSPEPTALDVTPAEPTNSPHSPRPETLNDGEVDNPQNDNGTPLGSLLPEPSPSETIPAMSLGLEGSTLVVNEAEEAAKGPVIDLKLVEATVGLSVDDEVEPEAVALASAERDDVEQVEESTEGAEEEAGADSGVADNQQVVVPATSAPEETGDAAEAKASAVTYPWSDYNFTFDPDVLRRQPKWPAQAGFSCPPAPVMSLAALPAQVEAAPTVASPNPPSPDTTMEDVATRLEIGAAKYEDFEEEDQRLLRDAEAFIEADEALADAEMTGMGHDDTDMDVAPQSTDVYQITDADMDILNQPLQFILTDTNTTSGFDSSQDAAMQPETAYDYGFTDDDRRRMAEPYIPGLFLSQAPEVEMVEEYPSQSVPNVSHMPEVGAIGEAASIYDPYMFEVPEFETLCNCKDIDPGLPLLNPTTNALIHSDQCWTQLPDVHISEEDVEQMMQDLQEHQPEPEPAASQEQVPNLLCTCKDFDPRFPLWSQLKNDWIHVDDCFYGVFDDLGPEY